MKYLVPRAFAVLIYLVTGYWVLSVAVHAAIDDFPGPSRVTGVIIIAVWVGLTISGARINAELRGQVAALRSVDRQNQHDCQQFQPLFRQGDFAVVQCVGCKTQWVALNTSAGVVGFKSQQVRMKMDTSA